MNDDQPTGRAAGGAARAAALSPATRQEIARNAAAKRWNSPPARATHGSADHPLKIGDIEIPCYVLADGRRVLSMSGVLGGLGMSKGTAGRGGDRLLSFAAGKGLSQFVGDDLLCRLRAPIRFAHQGGGQSAFGYEATILPDLCDVVLAARAAGALQKQQEHIAAKCEVLVRGFARVGIIALVDEATGYQKDRAKDALARILEAWVAKELQPYVKTFPADFYEHLFRLRGLQYPPERQNYRPQYFGVLTNDIVYQRLAPGLLDELKKQAAKDEKKAHLHRRLTEQVGHPRLKEHLASVTTIMKLSSDYPDFITKMNRIHPRFGDTYALELDDNDR